MDVTGAISAMKLQDVQQAVSVKMIDKAMDFTETAMDTMVQSLEAANPTPAPSFGHKLDVYA